MRIKRISILIGIILLLISADIVYAQPEEEHLIEFSSGSDLLNNRYSNNSKEITVIKQLMTQYKDIIFTGNGHIRLVAPVGGDKKDDLATINLAALRAIAVRNFLRKDFRVFTNWNFTFYLDDTRPYNNTIEVLYMPYAIPASVSPVIYCTDKQSSLSTIKQTLSNYGQLPYLNTAPLFSDETTTRAHFDKINATATNPTDVEPTAGEPNPEKLLIAIHYRWDRDNLDSLYLSNPENLHLLDSVLNSINSMYIDTLTIVAYASPEGNPTYNKRLSERRAKTIKNYIISRYKTITPERIITEARGENWKGLRNFVINDSLLPSRSEVLKIIDSPLPSLQKQNSLTKLNGGATYYRYILPNYYRYLRNGASVLITYSPDLPQELPAIPEPEIALFPVAKPMLTGAPQPIREPLPVVRYPIALKTNLLFDVVGAVNIGVEVPVKKHFSFIADFAYSYWRSPKNLYALQTLQGGVEGRYWFGVNEKKKQSNPEWAKPLRGWNIGAYGMYCSRYDVQWKEGYQGDGFWSSGVTAGYAMPIARNLSLEFSLAAGYIHTPEYRHYHRPEYDANGKYHLMWQETGSYGTFTLTKVRISLVWVIRTEKKGGRK